MTLRTWRRRYDRHVMTINGVKYVAGCYTCDDTDAWEALTQLSDYLIYSITDGVVFLVPR